MIPGENRIRHLVDQMNAELTHNVSSDIAKVRRLAELALSVTRSQAAIIAQLFEIVAEENPKLEKKLRSRIAFLKGKDIPPVNFEE
jgi:hypothetical protein